MNLKSLSSSNYIMFLSCGKDIKSKAPHLYHPFKLNEGHTQTIQRSRLTWGDQKPFKNKWMAWITF